MPIASHLWWAWLIRGLVSIIFSFIAFSLPAGTLASIILLFSAFMFIDGVFALVSLPFRRSATRPWWMTVLEGVSGIGIGLLTYWMPGLSALALLYWVAFWAVLTGVMEISAAIELRKTITQEWSLGILGGLSILVGVLYLAFPRAGLLSLAYILGVYAFFAGILMLSLAYRLWRLEHGKHDIHPPTTMHHV